MKHITSSSDYLQKTQVGFKKMAHWDERGKTVLNSPRNGNKWHEKVESEVKCNRLNVSFARRKEIGETDYLKKKMIE